HDDRAGLAHGLLSARLPCGEAIQKDPLRHWQPCAATQASHRRLGPSLAGRLVAMENRASYGSKTRLGHESSAFAQDAQDEKVHEEQIASSINQTARTVCSFGNGALLVPALGHT